MNSKDNNILISIIMGAFNAEEYISQCIDSIIDQTYPNWEFIICDDCSTDGTNDIVAQYAQADPRIKLIKNDKNLRLAASLNRCLEVAKGKYVARMDADDKSLPERLETQLEFMESHPEIDCVGSSRIIFDSNGQQGIRKSVEHPGKELLLLDTPFAHPTIMMKKEVYDALGGYTVSKMTMRAEDLDLWFRFFAKGYKGYNIQEPLYLYREGVEDLGKRTLKAGIQTAKVFAHGYKLIGVPFYKRILCIKPIISALVPKNLMKIYYKKLRS